MAGRDVPRLFCSDTDRDGDFDGAVPDPRVVAEAWDAWRAEVDFATRFVAEAPAAGRTFRLLGHHGGVIPLELAVRLREAGLRWTPAPGDRFALPDRGLDEVFVLSNMTIQVYELPNGSVIGFNGTTEWAHDDIEKDEAIWLPSEDQLRDRLGDAFQRLERVDGHYQVVTAGRRFVADHPEEAYGEALLHQLTR